jgi:branched-chain amino acid transport system permease protein
MDASFLFSQFMGGLTAAMFLFLIASGLSLVFGVMRVLNFAHGSFYMIGAYLAWQVVNWLQPMPERFWPAVLAASFGVALLGAIVERLLLRHLYDREELYQLLFTYALVLVLGDAAKFLWARSSSRCRGRRYWAGASRSSARWCRTTICSSCCSVRWWHFRSG